jgi:hypothetical protein
MDDKKICGTIGLALALLSLAAGGPPAEKARAIMAAAQAQAPASVQALIHPRPSGPIGERAAWARGEAKANRWETGFWLGFGIRRLMGEHSSMGWYPGGGPETHLTLDDIINGRKTALEKKVAGDQAARGTTASMPGIARSFAARRRGDEPERPVMKEIGILLHLNAGEEKFPADIRVSNLDLPFDLEDLPFIWVGMATDAESLAYLIPLYAQAAAEADKRSLLWAIGLHRDAPHVVPFVERILAGKESEEIRGEAAACLGEQNDPKALDLLLKTIKADPSSDVRERAVDGLVEMEIPAATDALTTLALGGADRPIRREAVRGLADKANAATVNVLEKIAAGDKDREVQQEAIHALADLPARSGLPYLVSLVKTHPDATVRKEAVEAVGDVGGAEAVRLLTEWAKGKRR